MAECPPKTEWEKRWDRFVMAVKIYSISVPELTRVPTEQQPRHPAADKQAPIHGTSDATLSGMKENCEQTRSDNFETS